MRFKINKEVTVDAELPYFSKNCAYAYKEIDENTCIGVGYSEYIKCSISESYVAFAFDKDMKEITEQEFNELFNQTLKLIQEL